MPNIKPNYSFIATNFYLITNASYVCLLSTDFIKVVLKLVKQKAVAGFGQPEETTHLLDYNAKRKVEKQVCQEREIGKSFCMYLKEMENQKSFNPVESEISCL